jgi:hypothetical protein
MEEMSFRIRNSRLVDLALNGVVIVASLVFAWPLYVFIAVIATA